MSDLDLDYTNDSNEEDYEDSEEDSEEPEPSVEEKISSLISDNLETTPIKEPITETTKEVEKPIVEEKIKVKVDGVEKEVTLEELKNGYSRQSDYTQKTQELALQKQQVEAQQREYQTYLQSIPMLAQVAQQNITNASNQLYSPELLELAKTDPAEYVAQKAQIEMTIAENIKYYQQMDQQYTQHLQQTQQQQNLALNEVVQRSNELLAKEIDGWTEGKIQPLLKEYGAKVGFTENELANVYDYRHIEILNKARLYDQLIENKGVAQKRVQGVPPKMLDANSSNARDEQAEFNARKRAALRSNDDRAIARIMAEML